MQDIEKQSMETVETIETNTSKKVRYWVSFDRFKCPERLGEFNDKRGV